MRISALGGALGGGAIAFTLMACYGGPPCDHDNTCPEPDRDSDSGSSDAQGGRDVNRPDVQVGPRADASNDATTDGGVDLDAADAAD